MPDPDSKPEIHERDEGSLVPALPGFQTAVRNIDAISRAVFNSVSWRSGQWAARLLRRLGMRIPASTAEAEMERLVGELKQFAEMPRLDRETSPDDLVLGKHFRLSETRPRRYPAMPPLRPEHWDIARETATKLEAQLDRWKSVPTISVVVPVHNTRAVWLSALIETVRTQFYTHWELVLVDDASSRAETLKVIAEAESESKITVVRRKTGGSISAATNDGIEVARGEYVAFVDHDDLLEPDTLLQVARAIEQSGADVIYTDEDKIDELGEKRYEPHCKPAWSPDLLLSQNYISHLTVIRRSLIKRVGRLNPEFDGSQDHDLLLRCAEHANEIVHVPMPLYHWRAVEGSTARDFGEKSYAWKAGRDAIESALRRRKVPGSVAFGDRPGTYRVNRTIAGEPKVSILVPFRDRPELLRQCIGSLLEKTEYANFEIIGLDNQSVEPGTLALMRELEERDDRVCFKRFDHPFNFSAINNFGAQHARGEHLLLLNNDIEVITPGWLGAMLGHSQRSEVGAVGAKLLYPDNRIQHAGAILGIGGVAGHSHKFERNDANGYFSRPHLTQNLSAVTGACLMVKKRLYQELGGLEERFLAVAFNDIDFCIRLRETGLLNIYEPAAVLYHHESISRGYEDSPEKRKRFAGEVGYMRFKHALVLAETDPYFNPCLAEGSETFVPR